MTFAGELRPFQREAHDQLIEWGRGLLAVTMGGGKTPITISVTEHLLDTEQAECGLVIVPASLKHQWNGKRGFPLFAPDAHVVVIDGDADQRREQYMKARHWAEYIVLGYSQVVDDWKFVKELPLDFVVMDEVQAIKNPGSARSQKVAKLLRQARRQGSFILGLTGQPLENKPEDVFHICAAIDPEVLGHPRVFDLTFVKRNKFGKPIRYDNLPVLKKRLDENIMVRVARDEISHYLPEQSEEDHLVEFDARTLKVYRRIVVDLVEALSETRVTNSFDLAAHYTGAQDSPASRAQRGKIMARLMCARMVCDHPNLLRLSADLYAATSVEGKGGALESGSAYAHELREAGVLDLLPPNHGPKFRAVVTEIRRLLDADEANKVVVFSQFKPTLFWLEHALRNHTTSVVFHGGVTPKKREELKDQFNDDPATRVFLSSDAGGAGVDLPGGNYLINYNLPFSAGQLDQRNARIDRMSSAHSETMVINFMLAASVEEFYADIVDRRKRTAAGGIDGKVGKSGSVQLPTGSLRSFLTDWLEEF